MAEHIVQVNVHNTKTMESLEDFCVRGLFMPPDLISGYSMAPNMDAFIVHTRNDLHFNISGPELAQWEYRRGITKVCSPERESDD